MIGLFFGSFNPIHLGHLVIANYMANYTALKEVWFVVSPHNPLKQKSGLADMYDRLEMVRLAIDDTSNLKASDIEFKLPQPSYTVETLTFLKEKFPEKKFALIMGADNLVSFSKWKNYEVILANYKIFVYPRPNSDLSAWEAHPSITITKTPQMDISSTFIRRAIKDNKSIKYLAPEVVIDFIERKSLYR